MNAKTVGFFLVLTGALQSIAGSDLIDNGSFDRPLDKAKAIYNLNISSITKKWVCSTIDWGWQYVSAGDQSYMAFSGDPKLSAGGSMKRSLVQSIPYMKNLRGKAVLRFDYFLQAAASAGSGVEKTITASVFGYNGSKPLQISLNNSLDAGSDLTLLGRINLSGDKTVWTPVSVNIDLMGGFDLLIVEFTGRGGCAKAGIDNVQFFSLVGETPTALPPAASAPVLSRNEVEVKAPAAVSSSPAISAQKKAPAVQAAPAPVKVVAAPMSRPVKEPVHPPVENLVLNGDFSKSSLALPTASGDPTAELSGRWIGSSSVPWEISPYGGNLGAYARAPISRDACRLLYVASDAGRSKGSYVLRFDYILTDRADSLGVRVFVSDRDIIVGTTGGVLQMNDIRPMPDMIELPPASGWTSYYLPVELGDGYSYIYILFAGSGSGTTGIDNVTLSPKRR